MNVFSSGHAFPELVQKEGDRIVAQINGIIWKTNYERIKILFEKSVNEPFSEGKEMLFEINIKFSEVYGLSLTIIGIDPSFSLGSLHKVRIETLKKLNVEGILSLNQQKKLHLPKRIALISAESSKGLSDFYSVIEPYKNKYGIETFLFNSLVQGDMAISALLKVLYKIQKIHNYFDAVVIVRGGGSDVGMSCYDNYELCKTIATFPIPVLTGIGHSTNLTIAEMVSYSHAITPTKLAEDIISTFVKEDYAIEKIEQQLSFITQKSLQLLKSEFLNAVKSLPSTTLWRIEQHQKSLQLTKQNIKPFSKQLLVFHVQKIKGLKNEIQSQFQNVKSSIELKYSVLWNQIQNQTLHKIQNSKFKIDQAEKEIAMMDPKSILARGFTITRLNSKVIVKVGEAQKGEYIETEFLNGIIRSKIES